MNKLVRHDESDSLSVGNGRGFRVNQKRSFTVGNKAPILHSPRRKIWNGDEVALADGKLKVEHLAAAVRRVGIAGVKKLKGDLGERVTRD